jgi:hypothetical protein
MTNSIAQDLNDILEGLAAAQQLENAGVGERRRPAISAVAAAMAKWQSVVTALDGTTGDQLLFLLHAEGGMSVEQLASLTAWDSDSVTARIHREIVRRLDRLGEEYAALSNQDARRISMRLLPHIDAQLDEDELNRVSRELAEVTTLMHDQPLKAGFEMARHSLSEYLPALLLDLDRQMAALRS